MNTEVLQDALAAVNKTFASCKPCAAIILGSGWSPAPDCVTVLQSIDYVDIPGMGACRIAGHAGKLVLASYGNREFLFFEGRRHWYENVGWEPVTVPVFLAQALGASCLVMTNAAGGIRADLEPGDLLLVEDHINAMGTTPLQGVGDRLWGSRFVDMSRVYDPELRTLIQAAAAACGETIKSGVYLAVHGPCYETPAEVRAFRTLGADAVGMSTVPEAILARAAGLRVAALSCITNPAAGLSGRHLDHGDVVRTLDSERPRLTKLLEACLSNLAAHFCEQEHS